MILKKVTNSKYLISLLFISHVGYGQPISNTLSSYMQEVRAGFSKPIPRELFNTQDQAQLFQSVQPYLSDTLHSVRSKAYYIVKRVGQNSSDSQIRTKAIDILITGINDQDTGISGNASESLIGFKKEEYTNNQRLALARLLKKETPHLDQVLKLAGYIQIPKDNFAPIITSNLPFKYKWAAHLALARMGDQQAITYILTKLQQAPLSDNFIYDFVPDLIYTRQLEIFKFLESIIRSDEQNCLSADPDASAKILCGYRVMEYLAPLIENYPLPTDEFGELEVDNYKEALQKVRTWFAKNESYGIKKDTF